MNVVGRARELYTQERRVEAIRDRLILASIILRAVYPYRITPNGNNYGGPNFSGMLRI
jgi:hypothetical protein